MNYLIITKLKNSPSNFPNNPRFHLIYEKIIETIQTNLDFRSRPVIRNNLALTLISAHFDDRITQEHKKEKGKKSPEGCPKMPTITLMRIVSPLKSCNFSIVSGCSETTELSSFTASSTTSRFGDFFRSKIAVEKSLFVPFLKRKDDHFRSDRQIGSKIKIKLTSQKPTRKVPLRSSSRWLMRMKFAEIRSPVVSEICKRVLSTPE